MYICAYIHIYAYIHVKYICICKYVNAYVYMCIHTYICIYTCQVPIWKSRESKFAKTPKYALFNKNEVTEEMIASLGMHSCIESRSDWEDKVCSVWCSVWCSV